MYFVWFDAYRCKRVGENIAWARER